MEEEENQGNLLLGIALGLIFPCLGIVIAVVLRGSRTLTGSIIGSLLNFLCWSCLGIAFGVLYPLLMAGSY
jgi:hypothetical protein